MKPLLIPVFLAILGFGYSADVETGLLIKALENPGSGIDILISFVNGDTTPIIKRVSETFDAKTSRVQKSSAIHSALTQHASTAQKSTLEFLEKFPKASDLKIRTLWITNQIYIKNADKDLIFGLAMLPDVDKIIENGKIHLEDPILASEKANEWGVDKIRTQEVWDMEGGSTGEGVVVGTIDTGVRWTHEAIRDNYLGAENNAWYDAYEQRPEAFDDHSHGTHVTGTICGKNSIGVAPDAKWMACKAFQSDGEGTFAAAIDCGQYFVCPHKPDGTEPDCSLTPHIVSNSWGDQPLGLDYFNNVIEAWRSIGIIPVFSAGNSGPNCQTIGYPARSSDVIAVGATDINDAIAVFSSVGPSEETDQKPEISAPGVNVRSSTHQSDSSYAAYSGTSMACPHTSGLIALMLSRNPEVEYDEILDILQNTTNKELVHSGDRVCNSVPDNTFPNYHYGFGRIDAKAAFDALISEKH